MDLQMMFLLFIIYSFLGWALEVCYVSIKNKKLTARGFFIGPYCPIYGTGALLMTLLLEKYSEDIFILFFMSCILGAILEYFTSYLMEKIFKTRWWDYSDKKYNVNGRICLENIIVFGILGVLMIKFLNPFFENILSIMPDILYNVLTISLLIIFMADLIVSFNIISNIKRVDLSDAKDSTEEVTKKVMEVLRQRSILNKRLVNAFPNLKIDFSRFKINKNV